MFPLFQEDGLSPREQELKDLKESLQDTQPVGVLVDSCRTMDQVRSAKIVTEFLRLYTAADVLFCISLKSFEFLRFVLSSRLKQC